jgi:hypothetical protein
MKTLRSGLIKRIHVDQHRVKKNNKEGTNLPVLTVQARGGPYKAHKVSINGPSELVYRPEKPLSCGARVWIATTAEVIVDGDGQQYIGVFCEGET